MLVQFDVSAIDTLTQFPSKVSRSADGPIEAFDPSDGTKSMHREYHRWHSPALNRPMELLVFGWGGARVLVYPTSKGRFFEWENRGLIGAFAEHINRGWLQFYCVDGIDDESWYAYHAHPGHRIWRHSQYDRYVAHEVLPLSEHKNHNPFLMVTGASFGAFHAMSFALRHPHRVQRVIGMSGLYDIRRFADGYHDLNLYFHNPAEFINHEHDHHRLEAMRRMDIIMAIGRDDPLLAGNREFSGMLWNKGIGNALRIWDGFAHDWQYWDHMLKTYVNGQV